ncbi:hypothetical protein Anas_13886 [Armadillidium nasatum]|uniref:Uncharacterized protein n=1 Tax=Armadillidium nasatum TaxID=96803 RepID=A0A5N5T672_9CRUS|nr:hypothetical protein Anas_13886 [Armadillidium nasatum]
MVALVIGISISFITFLRLGLVQSQALDRLIFTEDSCSHLKPCSALDLEMKVPSNKDVTSKSERMLFIAVGQASDSARLKNMRISACYTKDDAGFDTGGYVMYYISSGLLIELQALTIENHFIDENMFWCKFRRPIGVKSTNRIDIENPLFLFVYAGQGNDNTNRVWISISKQKAIKPNVGKNL